MLRSFILSFIIFLSGVNLASGLTDSAIADQSQSKARISLLTDLAIELVDTDYEKAFQYVAEAMIIAKNADYIPGRAKVNRTFAKLYTRKNLLDNAVLHYLRALDDYIIINNIMEQMFCYGELAAIMKKQNDIEKSLDYYMKALQISDLCGDTKMKSEYLNQIAIIKLSKNEYHEAADYFNKTIRCKEIIRDTIGMVNAINDLAIICQEIGEKENALKNFNLALDISKKLNDVNCIALSYNNLANYHYRNNDHQKCLDAYFSSLECLKNTGNYEFISVILNNIGMFHIEQGDLFKGISYLLQSLEISKQYNLVNQQSQAYANLANTYGSLNDYEKAFEYYKLYSSMKDSLSSKDEKHRLAIVDEKYQTEKKDKEILLLIKDSEINAFKMEKQKFFILTLIGGVILIFILLLVLFSSNRIRKKANRLLASQKAEINAKSILLEETNEVLEKKNLQITQSLSYAKLIQDAILPSLAKIKEYLPNTFVFYRPRDIVSGDFYWFTKQSNKLFFAVSDCTGHGVPGALMSMIGNSILNEIVIQRKIHDPSKILTELNKGVINTLHQQEGSGSQTVGMDMALCCIDKTLNQLTIASANQLAFLLMNDEVIVVDGEIYSIGDELSSQVDTIFTNQKFVLSDTKAIYLTSDGYADQFGGSSKTGEKFMTSRITDLILKIKDLPTDKQQQKFVRTFDEWKGNKRQIDDVLLIGIVL